MKDVIIVESPAKAKTISKYFDEFFVVATKGHIADLPKSKIGVDIDNGFIPEYVVSPDRKKIVREIKKNIPENGNVYIASDPDREGEAIGWHIARELGLCDINGKEKKLRGKTTKLQRIVFHEITKSAIERAFEESRKIDMDMVNAQQARRILDRIVGYMLSPLLWRKIRYGLSAGRVQSVALRLIVEREDERNAFVSETTYNIYGKTSDVSFKLEKIDKSAVNISKTDIVDSLINEIKAVNNSTGWVISDKKDRTLSKFPLPPFITSTLQQAANNIYGFTGQRTMSAAQKLYEGIKIGKNTKALITYMRTDSTNLSIDAINNIRGYIQKNFSDKYLPDRPNIYTKKAKLAQEAHEAIRCIDPYLTPDEVRGYLSEDEYKVYLLVWRRSISCQMTPYKFLSTSIFLIDKANPDRFLFKTQGSVVLFDGFRSIEMTKRADVILPNLNKGDNIKFLSIEQEEVVSQPPARYTDASLVKVLEKNGIGRPSTYAPIILTIIQRGYVYREGKQLIPTDTAYAVNNLLVKNFPEIVDVGFTSSVEESLDKIAAGKAEYSKVLSDFYNPFVEELKSKEGSIVKDDYTVLGQTDEKCPVCGGDMVIKLGKFGRFLSCKKFPDCKGIKSIGEELANEACPDCGKDLLIRKNSKGIKYITCSGYPDCKYTAPMKTGIFCPNCGSELVERKSKWGKFFYGCSKYPECKYILNKKKDDEETNADIQEAK